MQITKLYYSDPYLEESDSIVIERREDKAGQWICLDPVIFYPGGGGQTPDRGLIEDLQIEDIKEDSGKLWFLVKGSPPEKVKLRLDWEFRYLNMQQHTGQHILSAVLHRLFSLETVSVHLGQTETLIEIETDSISDKMIKESEYEANRVIARSLPVRSLLISKNELNKYPIRRDITYESDPVRLIQIGDYDYTGCGGTHVKNTAEVGLVKILKSEKIRGHIRLSTLIGRPAFDYFSLLHENTSRLTKNLSCAAQDLPDRVNGLIKDIKNQKSVLKRITTLWLKEYANRLEPQSSFGYFMLSDLDPEELGQLAREWTLNYKLPLFIISAQNGKLYFILQIPENNEKGADVFVEKYGSELGLNGGGSNRIIRGIINLPELDDHYSSEAFRIMKDYFLFEDN
jgi:alanyl-tRNA synthetase